MSKKKVATSSAADPVLASELSRHEQAAILADRYDLLASAAPRTMVVHIGVLAELMAEFLRIKGVEFDAKFLGELRQLCAGTEEGIVQMRASRRGGR